MSSKTHMSKSVRRVSQRFKVTYKALNETMRNPNSAPIRDNKQRDARSDPLTNYNHWPMLRKPPNAEAIKKHKTFRGSAEQVLREFEDNFIGHVLAYVPYECVDDHQLTLENMLEADPLGLKPIPQVNTDFWKTRKIGIPTGKVPLVTAPSTTVSSTDSSDGNDASESSQSDSESEGDGKASAAKSTATAKKSGGEEKTSKKVVKKAKKASKKKKKRRKKGKKKKKAPASGAATAAASGAAIAAAAVVTGGAAPVSTGVTPVPASKPSVSRVVTKTTIMVHTPLYNTLLNLNDQYYKYIRASVFRCHGMRARVANTSNGCQGGILVRQA